MAIDLAQSEERDNVKDAVGKEKESSGGCRIYLLHVITSIPKSRSELIPKFQNFMTDFASIN